MKKTNKILLVIFLFLLLVLTGELIYLFFISQTKIEKNSLSSVSSIKKTQYIPPTKKNLLKETASYLDSISDSQIINSLTYTLEFQSTIKEIKKENKLIYTTIGNAPLDVVATILLENNGNGIGYYITAKELSNLKIVKLSPDGKKETIDFNDLKIGDKIKLKITIDPFKYPDENIIEGEIIKY